MKQFLEAGKIVSVHGVKGEVKIYPLCDSLEFLCGLKKLYADDRGEKQIEAVSLRPHKNMVIAKLSGCDSVEQARLLIDDLIYFARGDAKLEDGQYYIDDLIGLAVRDADTGTLYGTVCSVGTNTAQDVYSVQMPDGETRMLPAVKEFVRSVSLERGEILVTPIKGMFSDED